ncbi:MAG: SH3 domain-containing protein [Leptospiraceae bacterium]|nr:SH3 domain-containing protein [Leptospiraceae bacterium]MDW8307164.1 SH3 domain-containing protein [Leptospiraceae bacterium]
MPLFFLLFSLYLIFGKFYKSPLVVIEESLQSQNYERALQLSLEEAEKKNRHSLRYLMLAVVAAEGLESPSLGDLEKELARLDASGIYLKESFLKRLTLLPKIPQFPRLVENFLAYFSQSVMQEAMSLIERHVQTDVEWKMSEDNERFFLFVEKNLPHLLHKTKGEGVYLRKKPSREAEVVTILKKGTRLLRRLKGPEEVIGTLRASWFYVFTETGHSGWIYGAYLSS